MNVNVKSKISKYYRFNMNGDYMHVYEGVCDGIPHKWLTYDEWDYFMIYNFKAHKNINDEFEIVDSHGSEILVFDDTDPEFKDIKPLSKRGEYKMRISEKKKEIDRLNEEIKELKKEMPRRKKGLFKRI